MPSAPNSLATFVSVGVSALVLTRSFLYLSTHFINFEKSPEISGLTVGTLPSITFPLPPSIVIISPSFISLLPDLNNLFS